MASTDATTTVSNSAAPKLYTREEVRAHNSKTSSWIIIHDKVYDVTGFLNEHPGGEDVLLVVAGEDGTETFEDIGHSSDARQMMQPLQIGELVESETTKNQEKRNVNAMEDSSSASWRPWLIPLAVGVLATIAYRYILNAH